MELTGLKVKIGLKPQGGAQYPPFNNMNTVKASLMDWCHYVDNHGLSWHYDKTSGHKDNTPGSPMGVNYGLLLIPEAFAVEAVAMFPGECERLSEVDTAAFYDDKAHAHEPDEIEDEKVMSALQRRLDLMDRTKVAADAPARLAHEAKVTKAMDPNDSEPGVKKNERKKWADKKAKMGVVFKESI